MALEPEMSAALQESAKRFGQPDALIARIEKTLEAFQSNYSATDKRRHLEEVFNAIQVPKERSD